MEYGQVVTLLFVALLGYYVFLIVTDLQKAKAAQMAEQENHMEEDIDISDEAQSFQPKKVGREEEKRKSSRKTRRNQLLQILRRILYPHQTPSLRQTARKKRQNLKNLSTDRATGKPS